MSIVTRLLFLVLLLGLSIFPGMLSAQVDVVLSKDKTVFESGKIKHTITVLNNNEFTLYDFCLTVYGQSTADQKEECYLKKDSIAANSLYREDFFLTIYSRGSQIQEHTVRAQISYTLNDINYTQEVYSKGYLLASAEKGYPLKHGNVFMGGVFLLIGIIYARKRIFT